MAIIPQTTTTARHISTKAVRQVTFSHQFPKHARKVRHCTNSLIKKQNKNSLFTLRRHSFHYSFDSPRLIVGRTGYLLTVDCRTHLSCPALNRQIGRPSRIGVEIVLQPLQNRHRFRHTPAPNRTLSKPSLATNVRICHGVTNHARPDLALLATAEKLRVYCGTWHLSTKCRQKS